MADPIIVDTFEHDIANEIRRKESFIGDIAAATSNIGGKKTVEKPSESNKSMFTGIIVILVLCGLVGAGYLAYLSYLDSPTISDKVKRDQIKAQEKKLHPGIELSTISPTLDQAIGTFLTNAQKVDSGYNITVVSYPPVFSYMIKNESQFGDEIALAIGNSHTLKNKTTNSQVKTPDNTSTSSVATTSQINGTSTTTSNATTSDTGNTPTTSYIFSDITISNQNMRIATSIYGTVVYAFIGTQKLVISSSTDGILQLRSNILRK